MAIGVLGTDVQTFAANINLGEMEMISQNIAALSQAGETETEAGPDDDSYARRRAVADHLWREHRGRLPESAADEEQIARELRDAVASEIWVKRKRGRSPNQ